MKKLLFIATIMLVVLSGACSMKEPNDFPLLEVTKSTYLYNALDIDSALPGEMPAGTLLKPADGKSYFSCRTITELGTDYSLCHVELVDSGQTGWVLEKWTKPK